jgi:hypothetical protein
MTSKLKVNILADGGDNAIMTSDGSGSLTLNNAALKNTPVLSIGLASTQTMSDVSSGTPNVYGVSSTRFGTTFQMVKLIGA